MKTITRSLVATFAAVLLAVGSLTAQQYSLSNTTLAATLDSSQTNVALTSASASAGSSFGAPAAGQCLFVDGEFMRINSISGTTATVTRAIGAGGAPGTQAVAHVILSIVFTGACNAFKQSEPAVQFWPVAGRASGVSCSTQPAPWINVNTGNIWWCNTTNQQWSGTNFRKFTYGSVPIAQ